MVHYLNAQELIEANPGGAHALLLLANKKLTAARRHGYPDKDLDYKQGMVFHAYEHISGSSDS